MMLLLPAATSYVKLCFEAFAVMASGSPSSELLKRESAQRHIVMAKCSHDHTPLHGSPMTVPFIMLIRWTEAHRTGSPGVLL